MVILIDSLLSGCRLGPWAFLAFAGVALLSALYAWLLVPETRGKTLVEVQVNQLVEVQVNLFSKINVYRCGGNFCQGPPNQPAPPR